MEGELELVCDLSNGAISNDLERTLTLFSRSHHSLTLNISNGYRYGNSYCRRRIGNHTQAFEWHQFQWPLTQISRSWYYSTSNNSNMVQDGVIFTMDDQQKIACGLSNGAIFSDLERSLTWFSRLRHSLTLTISQTATDTAIVTM